MSHMHVVVHKAVTDPTFRTAFLADPQAAVTRWNLEISSEEMSILLEIARSIALPSQDLLDRLLASANGPEQEWKGQQFKRYAGSEAG